MTSGPKVITSGARRVMDVQPPSSAGCHDYGGDVWACDVIPGMSYDLPVTSKVDTFSDPAIYCSNASPVFYWVKTPPRGITVTLLSASGGSSCGSVWTGTVRVTLSAQAPWENNGPPDFSFKLVYTACGSHAPADCVTGQNGFAQTGGTRYTFWTPWPPHGFPAIPERACGRCNGTTIGKPIDVASGEVWNEKTDLALSGPFGLSFTRFYGNQTAGSADLGGTNWLHTYAASLDVSDLSNGKVTYYDNRGMPYYFTAVARGASSYDNASGLTLALLSDGSAYTLTAFDSRNGSFDSAGRLLALHDRVGNAQTVVRDANNGGRIASVADFAGRQLCFYYDGVNRIVAVAAWTSIAACPATAPASSVTTPVVTLGYNTGLNCSANSLCAVTEPDGKTWTYEYTSADTTYPYNLSEVLDPLGNPEEVNGFSGNRVTHQETGSCSSSPCSETGGFVNIAYPASGSSPVAITDGLGRASSITYDPNTLLLTRISGPVCQCGGDQTRTFAYDASQRLTSESDDGIDGSVKHTTTYAYGRDIGGRTYPGPTSITENVNAAGTSRSTTLSYYAVGDSRQDLPQTMQQPSVDYPGQFVTTADTYSTTGLLTQRTTTGYVNQVSTSYTSRWAYDTRGRLVSQTSPRTDVNATTTFQYFSDTSTDAAISGQLKSVTDALGHSVQYATVSGFASYTPFGDAQSTIDSNGVSTEYGYDVSGRIVSSTLLPAAEGDQILVTQTVYDAAGRRTQHVLPGNNRIGFGYDTSGRLRNIMRLDASAALREQLLVTYNAFDQTTALSAQSCTAPSISCANWLTTWQSSNAYSPTSTLAQVINADNSAKRVTYTAQGALASFNDENHPTGSDYTYAYDLAGRELSETRVLGGATGGAVTTRYTYDLDDNVTTITDPNGNVTTLHYDDFYRVTKEMSPVTGVTTYSYDADSNLISSANANGTTATYTYDALDRRLTETDTKGSASASEAWTYDDPTVGHFGIGRLATMTDPSGSTAFSYDRRGNVEVENHNVAGNSFTYGYGYDPNGNRYEVTYPDGTIVTYSFDFADRPYSAQQVAPQDPSALSVARRARSLGRLRAKGLAAPVHAAKSELPSHPLATVRTTIPLPPTRTVTAPGRGVLPPSAGRSTAEPAGTRRAARGTRPDSILVASTTYAPFGPMTSMAFGNGTTQTMTYNQRYFPQENKLVGSGRTLVDQIYSEDAVGNVTAIADLLDSGYARNFSYDDLNRLTTANSGSKLWGTASGNGYSYDAMGNVLTQRLGTSRYDTFTYQAGGTGSAGLPMLSSVLQNGSTTRPVAYDAAGSELNDGVNTMAYGARELMGSALPNLSAYAYDGFRRRVQTQTSNGLQRVSLYDNTDRLLGESAASAAPTSIAYDYVWFGDRPVAQLDVAGTHWTVADHLGTPLLQTDSGGSVSWQVENEPYGLTYASRAGDVHQPVRLPGQEIQQFDAGPSGLNAMSYNGARWYRARWGRYTQGDPLHLGGGANLYAYANSRPINYADPLGEVAGPKAYLGALPHIKCPKWGLDRVIANIHTAQNHYHDAKWFISMVDKRKPWDYKAQKAPPGVSYDDLVFLGNFNFGATGNAVGVPSVPWLLEAGATRDPKDPAGPEPGGSGKRGWHGVGGEWPYGEQASEAVVEEDGWMFAKLLIENGINLCKKDPRPGCR
jgi:RHS repeat-associated protein